MPPDIKAALTKLSFSAVAIVVIFVISHFKSISLTNDIKLVLPSAKLAALWLVGWVGWVAVAELISVKMGVGRPSSWSDQSVAAIVLLCVGVVVLAPLAEELVFRGILYWKIEGTRLGTAGAIAAGAVFFAVLHSQYGLLAIAFILVDGLLFGLARHHSQTVTLPILMHCIGNSYAAWQRVHT